jgi:hypothetical protein
MTADQVLAHVRPGLRASLRLSPRQRSRIRLQPDGEVALRILRHIVPARAEAGADHLTFPLIERFVQRAAARLGLRLGQRRCRAIIRLLAAEGLIEAASSYRQPYRSQPGGSGYCVVVWRLRPFLVSAIRGLLRRPAAALRSSKASVGTRNRASAPRRPKWWQHPLFGDPSGLPPPGISPRRAARMHSEDELLYVRTNGHPEDA